MRKSTSKSAAHNIGGMLQVAKGLFRLCECCPDSLSVHAPHVFGLGRTTYLFNKLHQSEAVFEIDDSYRTQN